MSKVNARFKIVQIEIKDSKAIFEVDLLYASHIWRRGYIIDLDQGKFTYQILHNRIRQEMLELVEKRSQNENNVKRLERMIGQERSI